MELSSAALVSLALLLSNGQQDPQAVDQIMQSLSAEQVAAIKQIQDSRTYLPGKFEKQIETEKAPFAHIASTDYGP